MNSGPSGILSLRKYENIRKKITHKGIIAGFEEKKINTRNIKTSQFSVLFFSLIKDKLRLLFTVRVRGRIDHNDILNLACSKTASEFCSGIHEKEAHRKNT